MCRMQLIVRGEGVAPTAVEFEGLVHRKRWPQPGMMLPVTVDPANPQNVSIEWDEVPDSRDRSRANAEAMAAMMRGEGAAAGDLGGAQVINLSGSQSRTISSRSLSVSARCALPGSSRKTSSRSRSVIFSAADCDHGPRPRWHLVSPAQSLR
jgi:hypothetical protein